MKQYKVTYQVDTGEEDCVLDPSDPLYKMKEQMFLGSVSGVQSTVTYNTYDVYPEDDGTDLPKNPYAPT